MCLKGLSCDIPLCSDNWATAAPQAHVAHMIIMDPRDLVLVSTMNPLAVAAHTSKYDVDNPPWELAIKAPFRMTSGAQWRPNWTHLKIK